MTDSALRLDDAASGPAASGPAASAAETIAALREEALRARAEAENARKRARAEGAALAEAATDGLLSDLLPVLDHLEKALETVPDEGYAHIARHLRDVLGRAGLRAVEPSPGDRFDPIRHEATERRETAEVAEGTVVEVFRKGYTLRGRLLRPAAVAVAVEPAAGPAAPASAPAAGEGAARA